MPMKRILVPVDFSKSSRFALDTAAELARLSGGQVDLLHVWELPPMVAPQEIYVGAALPRELFDRMQQDADRTLERFAADAREAGVAIGQIRAMPGQPYDTIVEEARRGGYDLIVIGTHGRKLLARIVVGSVAERVVRHAHCPVLVARAPAAPAPAA